MTNITIARHQPLKFNEVKITNAKMPSASHITIERRDQRVRVYVDAAEANKNGVLLYKKDRFDLTKEELKTMIDALQQMHNDWS